MRSPRTLTPTFLLPALAAVLMSAPAMGQQPPPAAAPPPTPWLTAEDYAGFRPDGTDAGKFDAAIVTLDTPAGSAKGFQFTTRETGRTAYAEQFVYAVPRPIEAGDALSAHFYMRTTRSLLESGEGVVAFVVENRHGFEKLTYYDATVANQWKEFNVPFTAKANLAPGDVRVMFRVGTQKQTVEIAALEIRNYHKTVPLASLPRTKIDLSYVGMEPDAPWRAEAAARIAKYRQSTLTVQVVDAAGKPVPNARVAVHQTRHAFGFGTEFSAEKMFDPAIPAAEREIYQNGIAKYFNFVTIGNHWKWPLWEKEKILPIQASQWCKDHNLELRGHNMVWPGWRHLPNSLKPLANKPDEMRAAVLAHVAEVGRAAAPYVSTWDVVNETYDNHDLMDLCGESLLVDVFNAAKQADPKAALYINDYNIVTNNGLDAKHQEVYEKVIQYLLDQHAPLEGIGLQGHFGRQFTPPARVYSILERYAKFGLPMQMTEFTLMADDQKANAHFMEDTMTVFFSHPSVNAFIFWGAFDGIDYPHKAEIFDKTGQFTVVGKAWHDLVFGRWWTQEEKKTAANGTAAVQGFHGDYEIIVSGDGGKGQGKSSVALKPGGSTVKVVLAL